MAQTELTIHDLAIDIRQNAIKYFGEDEWARYCMWFEQDLPAISDLPGKGGYSAQLLAVYQLMARDEDARDTQLAICWLDGKGLGSTSLRELEQTLARIRS